jgi:predicted HicB family RNase H-like nuclease
MKHKDYVAEIELDEETNSLFGIVINTKATLHFTGKSVDELRQEFANTIASYEEWCRERGKEPERPYSGSFTLRMPPDLHRRVAEAAARSGKSLNGFIEETLEHAT